jgi:hypothetical protein
MSAAALAETEVVISKKNSFGGITKKINYSEQDSSYKAGIKQVIDYSDGHGNKRKIEIYTSKKHSQKLDLDMIIHYKSTGRVFEFFPSDKETGGQGVSKLILYYSGKDKLQKREYYFAKGSPLLEFGVYKRVIYYDEAGGVTKVEHFDKIGKKVMPQ